MKTDTTEKGLETLIMRYMTGEDGFEATVPAGQVGETPDEIMARAAAGSGYFAGNPIPMPVYFMVTLKDWRRVPNQKAGSHRGGAARYKKGRIS
jgi:hypothetical protein